MIFGIIGSSALYVFLFRALFRAGTFLFYLISNLISIMYKKFFVSESKDTSLFSSFSSWFAFSLSALLLAACAGGGGSGGGSTSAPLTTGGSKHSGEFRSKSNNLELG